MAGRGKLIAVIGDEDTVTGFLLGGIGELNKNRHPNFLVVEKDTTINEIEDTFRYGSLRGLERAAAWGSAGEGRGDPGSEVSDPYRDGRRPSNSVRPSEAEASAPSSLLGPSGLGSVTGP